MVMSFASDLTVSYINGLPQLNCISVYISASLAFPNSISDSQHLLGSILRDTEETSQGI